LFHITGNIVNYAYDVYNFDKGKSVSYEGMTIGDDILIDLQKAGAKGYKIKSTTWNTPIKAGSYFTIDRGFIWDDFDYSNIIYIY
jgi:hypothetical protein